MTAPRYEVISKRDEAFGIVWQETVLDLPDAPVGTSIRLTRTEDGWTWVALRSIRLGALPGPTTVQPPIPLWVDAAEQGDDRG